MATSKTLLPPKIAITPGEPAGIGPDIVVQLAQLPACAEHVVIANPELLNDRAQRLKLPLKLKPYNPNTNVISGVSELTIVPVALSDLPPPGKAAPSSAHYVIETLKLATNMCQTKQLDALVTGPINKHFINLGLNASHALANKPLKKFTGHTEYLAEITNTPRVVMMLMAEKTASLKQPLRVALATTHLPLKDVAKNITQNLLEEVISILHHDLSTHFGIADPYILVCGLNPHAGENGDLGDEEIRIINPCLDALRDKGIRLSQAIPADTLFTAAHLQQADAVLAMYHDQGLPVLKSHSFGHATNITLGLPIIRTSVDHGTAFELAGTGKANIGSLQTAIATAITLCRSRAT